MPPGLDLIERKRGFVGPTFTLRNRARRALWSAAWLLLARWTPAPLHPWRVFILRCFGADIVRPAYVYADVEIWAPWNLRMDRYGALGPGVRCYNMAPISVGSRAVVSQHAHLCAASHDYRDPDFRLTAHPIEVGDRAWICAGATVGPGVVVGEGAILALGAVTTRNLDPWTIYAGNPAVRVKARPVAGAEEGGA